MATQIQQRLLRLPEVQRRVGLSRSSIYKAIRAGEFPKPIALGLSRSRAWPSGDIEAWIQQQIRSSIRS